MAFQQEMFFFLVMGVASTVSRSIGTAYPLLRPQFSVRSYGPG
jgi:hypothetical protein